MLERTIIFFDIDELNLIDEVTRIYKLPLTVDLHLEEYNDEGHYFVNTETDETYNMTDGLECIVEAIEDDDGELLDTLDKDDLYRFTSLCEQFDINVPLTPKERQELKYLLNKNKCCPLDKEELSRFYELENRQ